MVDPANALPMVGAETVLANRYGTHPIVRSLSEEALPLILPLARSVTKAEKPPDGIAETMLVETSPEGWGETNLRQLEGGIKKEPGDTQGPVSLAIAVGAADEKKADAKVSRVVLVGNSRFAGQRVARQRRQRDLLRQHRALAGGNREADRHRAEDAGAGVGVAERQPGAAHLDRVDRGTARARGPAGRLGLVQAARLILSV